MASDNRPRTKHGNLLPTAQQRELAKKLYGGSVLAPPDLGPLLDAMTAQRDALQERLNIRENIESYVIRAREVLDAIQNELEASFRQLETSEKAQKG